MANNLRTKLSKLRHDGHITDIEYKELEKVLQYRAIGTVEEFRVLKKKNELKKAENQGEHEKCPTCGSFSCFW